MLRCPNKHACNGPSYAQGCGRTGCPGAAAAQRPLEDLPADRGQENRATSPSRRRHGEAQHAGKHACCGCRPSVHAEAALARVVALQNELKEQARRHCGTVCYSCRWQCLLLLVNSCSKKVITDNGLRSMDCCRA